MAIEINPNNANTYYNRGFSKYELGDKNGACVDWKKAAEYGATSAAEKVAKHCN